MTRKLTLLFPLISILALTNCKKETKTPALEQEHITVEENPTAAPQPVSTSKLKFTPLEEAIGDLDNDGIDEKVVVFNTSIVSSKGIEREIQFFKKDNSNNWTLWKKTREGILESKMEGVVGDPFKGIDIQNGIFIVNHSGESHSKWETTNKYRFQNGNFELIGYTQEINTPCENSLFIDYNLSTGNAVLQRADVTCNNYKPVSKNFKIDKKVNHQISPLPHLQDGKSSDIITPLLKAAKEPNFFS